jgi:hypothetical protein
MMRIDRFEALVKTLDPINCNIGVLIKPVLLYAHSALAFRACNRNEIYVSHDCTSLENWIVRVQFLSNK